MKRLFYALLALVIYGIVTGGCATTPAGTDETHVLPRARAHPYLFAHRYLVELFYKDPLSFKNTLDTQGKQYLLALWNSIGEKVVKEGEAVVPEGLNLARYQLSADLEIYLITCPVPRGVTEAFFVAPIFYRDKIYFFTLELTFGSKEHPLDNNYFCAWTAPGRHYNFGIALFPPSAENFLAAINEFVTK